MTTVLILGSAPDVLRARDWPRDGIDAIVAINNAWAVRPDWDVMIHPYDFAPERMPSIVGPGQRIVDERDFVPTQNEYGGFVYAGGTMAFTTGYWALAHYRPKVLAFLGCDMIYAPSGQTHFYGTGIPDPLRRDVTLRSLEAKSARLRVLGAMQGAALVNLSAAPSSRLVFPRANLAGLSRCHPEGWCQTLAKRAMAMEEQLGYFVPSGRYWEEAARFDANEIDALDTLWLRAADPAQALSA